MDTGSAECPIKRAQSSSSKESNRFKCSISEQAFSYGSTLLAISVVLTVACGQQQVVAANDRVVQVTSNKNLDQMANTNSQRAADGLTGSGVEAGQNGALEAELNSIVQQHESNNKQLAEALIARLMVDNLTGSSLLSGINDMDDEIPAMPAEFQTSGVEPFGGMQQEQLAAIASGSGNGEQATGYEAMRLRKWLAALRNYESVLASSGGGAGVGLSINASPYPVLPSSLAATSKRAGRLGNMLQSQPRQLSASYGGNKFDFGLGKRPDSAVSGNILRYGDGLLGGQIQPSGQFGKRPSSHRYDFGLGKRVASPAYPRYDFGLGKRAPNRIRYDFGLGK